MNPTPTPNPNHERDPKKEPQLGQEKKQSGQQQMQGGEGQEYGEGNYKATRQYNDGLKEHLQNNDTEREARDAAPRTADEEREMQEAERVGRSKSRGEGGADGVDRPDEGKQ